MVEVLRSPSFVRHLPESEDDVSTPFMRLDLSSLKEEQRLHNEKQHQQPQEQQNAHLQQLQSWQWAPVASPSGTSTPKGNNYHEPRRAFSTTEGTSRLGAPNSFLLRSPAASRPLSPICSPINSPRATPSDPHDMVDSYFQMSEGTLTVAQANGRKTTFLESQVPGRDNIRTAFGRPILPGPQRSYSVMDYEPVPFTHQPGTALLLVHLPPELHYAIFDWLDPIDSTAFGLTSKHFYIIHRQMHNKVSLSARRSGPNDMEWVWRHAGPFIGGGRNGAATKHNALAELSPRGQVYCRKCRTQRCELHNHIREFFPDGMEYCEVTQKFGNAAATGAKPICHRSSPRHPHRCGRHTRQQRIVRLA